MTSENELDAMRSISAQLRPFPAEARDRIMRWVMDALARERAPSRIPPQLVPANIEAALKR